MVQRTLEVPRARYSHSQIVTQEGGVLTFAYDPGFDLAFHTAVPDLYRSDSVQLYPVGTKYEIGPNVYRYVNRSGSPSGRAGDIVESIPLSTDADNFRPSVTALVGSVELLLRTDTALVGGLDANLYQGGLIYHRGTTAPAILGILAHEGLGAGSTTATFRLALDRPLPVEWGTGSTIRILGNRYGVRQSDDPSTSASRSLMGVMVGTLSSANRWAWMCTRGPTMVKADNNVEIGRPFMINSSAEGRAHIGDYGGAGSNEDLLVMGYMLDTSPSDGAFAPAFVMME